MSDDATRSTGTEMRTSYARGVMLLVAGTIAFSSAGFFVRLLGKDAATLLFWCGVFTLLTVSAYLIWREGPGTIRKFLELGLPGLAVALLSTASMGCFIVSLQYTTVANNSILFGTGPFLTAGIAWLMIRERPSVATLVFSGFALLGAMMVVGNSLQVSADSVFGDLLAVLMTITFAAKTVLVRKHPELPMVHASAFGALLGSIGALPFVPSWAITWGELAIFALFGLCQQGAGMILTTLGIRHVPAAHSALLMSLDVPMSPMWVWLAFGELPGRLAVAGGGVVLAAIVGHIVVEGRRRRT